ncbi:HAMP domain-containing sensor histidine kinase [Dyadobacter tibetensis]|uniref:HAMP domain-containing sensor histidine kinase n=1 Tax=Dyadobacter tibetensis TaxID=1211851 RepID=UPI00047142D9|nr:histidine kinase dimerization/phospho-acceptor domain-containing protein [Dyadobacter tibetensis]
MTLKRRISIYISLAFSILFGISITVVYILFASFRQTEFEQRLQEKALTTVNLLLTVKEIDKKLLQVIDQNSINQLYNEKTLIFDENYQLIYSSIDDAAIHWNRQDLIDLKKTKTSFRVDQELDLIGVYFDFEKADYYALVAAEDLYGNSKLEYLKYLLLVTFFVGSLLVSVATYYIVRRLTLPLDLFQKKIDHISAAELNTELPVAVNDKDEISQLTRTFNRMLVRIDQSFSAQREFTANASHELRTPISRIMLQVENLLENDQIDGDTRTYLQSIGENVNQLSALINSLLLLAKNNQKDAKERFRPERIDEIIFAAYEQVRRTYPDFKLHFEIADQGDFQGELEVRAARSVLELAFANLFRNAYQYSSDRSATVSVSQHTNGQMVIVISNEGESLTVSEQNKIFQPFTRGSNARHSNGSGLGLGMVKRILDYHHATIVYSTPGPNTHQFELTFIV